MENVEKHDDWYGEEEKPLDQVTMKEVEGLCDKLFQQKKVVEGIEDELKDAKEIFEKMKDKVLSYLTHFNKDNYRSAFGMVIKNNVLDVRVVDKQAFTEFLRSRDLLEDYTTFNANKVKGLAKEEIDIAAKEGKEFEIPGLGKPNYIEKLSIRK